jgi:hypothetical protein
MYIMRNLIIFFSSCSIVRVTNQEGSHAGCASQMGERRNTYKI